MERLQAIQNQNGSTMCDEFRQSFALPHAVPIRGSGSPNQAKAASRNSSRSLRIWFVDRLCQPEVDDFRGHSASLLEVRNDIAWFDVPVNELLLVHGSQTGGDLRRNFQRRLYLKPARLLPAVFCVGCFGAFLSEIDFCSRAILIAAQNEASIWSRRHP